MYRNPFNQTTGAALPGFPSSIEVTGVGSVDASPDRAVIVLGTVSEGTVLQTVQNENAIITANIIQSLLDLKIPRENIQTNDYRVEAQYDYQDGKQIFRGYKVTHMLQVTTDKVGDTGVIVDTAVSHGANMVSNIRFTISHPEKAESQALSLAVQNARVKAATIAQTLGVTLAAVPILVQEISRGSETPVPFAASMHMVNAVTPIQPGQLSIQAAVRVWYLYG